MVLELKRRIVYKKWTFTATGLNEQEYTCIRISLLTNMFQTRKHTFCTRLAWVVLVKFCSEFLVLSQFIKKPFEICIEISWMLGAMILLTFFLMRITEAKEVNFNSRKYFLNFIIHDVCIYIMYVFLFSWNRKRKQNKEQNRVYGFLWL